MATLILVHDYFDAEHLAAVTAEMRTLGGPTLRAVETGEGEYYLLEGCHRARAAVALGKTITLELVDYDCETDEKTPLCELVDGLDSDTEAGRVIGRAAFGPEMLSCDDVEIA